MTKAAQKVEYTPTSSPATKRPNINKSPEDRAKPKGKSKAKEHAAPVPSTSAAPEEGPCPVCNKMFPLNELAVTMPIFPHSSSYLFYFLKGARLRLRRPGAGEKIHQEKPVKKIPLPILQSRLLDGQ
ncbi:hypothetical protein Zmor_019478 [Zophobas morio]|uniref:Uncharacterized protein n=1 Tax=Zophobas morio TaxID=2755281 RepID=A0AA38I5Z1_9CUCU|nr:hypothetical protein Zmor_019478 [Zophobas morio]